MTRAGIVVALPQEARSLTTQRLPPGKVQSLSRHSLLCLSGVGAERAERATQQLIDRGADLLISWGTAVALSTEIETGCVLLPTQVMTAQQQNLATDTDWRTALQQRLQANFTLSAQTLLDSDQIINTAGEKQALHVRSGAVAADMESAAIGRMARANGIPFVVIRVIADTATMRLPGWLADSMGEDGQARLPALSSQLLRHPTDWPAFFNLARCFLKAQAVLKNVAEKLDIDTLTENQLARQPQAHSAT